FFGGLKAVKDGVDVDAIQRGEEGLCLFVLLQFLEEIGRSSGLGGRIIGGGPAAVGLGGFDDLQTGGGHVAGFYEAFGVLGVALRPAAFGPARSEFLKP